MSESVSTKQIVLEVIVIIKLLLSKIKWFIIIGLFGGALFFFVGKKVIKGYVSEVSFTLASNSGGAFSSYMALASQFGITSGENTTEDKLVALLGSKRVIISSLLKKSVINKEEVSLINYYAKISGLQEDWADKSSHLKGFEFSSMSYDSITFIEDSLFENIVVKLLKTNINTEIDKESNIIYLEVSNSDEVFAYEFSKSLVHSVIDYYTWQSYKKEKETYEILNSSLDSVISELKFKEELLAKQTDKKNNLVRKEGNVEELRLMREVEILSLMYAEGLKNLELAKISFLEKKAVVDIIDRPILPLKNKKISGVLLILIGGVLLCGIYSIIVIFRHYFNLKELWNNENLH